MEVHTDQGGDIDQIFSDYKIMTLTSNHVDYSDDCCIFSCPHCEMRHCCQINDVNCGIFRCGFYKDTLIQINPHESEAECNRLKANDLVFGCAKPFKIEGEVVLQCGYE